MTGTAVELDLYSPQVFGQGPPHDLWAELRRHEPVSRSRAANGTPFWSVTRHADCEFVLKNPKLFSSTSGTILGSVGADDSAGGRTITLMDPPDHGQLRRPAIRVIGHSIVRRRIQEMRQDISTLLAGYLDGESHDFAELTHLLPMAMSGRLLGIPPEHWSTVATNMAASIAPDDPTHRRGRSVEDTLRESHHALFACFLEVIERRRAEPGDDLISALLTMTVNGSRLEDLDVMLNCFSLLIGANSTTPHLVAQILQLLTDQDLVRRLLAGSGRPGTSEVVPLDVDRFLEEAARWATPTHHLVRRCSSRIELAGRTIEPGDWVCLWIGSANRDERVFEEADAFRPDRSPNPHLSFGAGPHYCIGAPISRAGLRIVVDELLTRTTSIESTGAASILLSNWIHGYTALPLRAIRRED
ncbi:cytochrome P450 [Microlunatus soli]|uniref:Cytochrome P450 n=1 Tax=Microlunatus soli TaxID=630515 RepID=A0A1H1VVD4_9ACTN|nr:cytochrome P450 [Microlunatus soli]SDS88665.1 Cytochrome P450 [Microlunatus soli]